MALTLQALFFGLLPGLSLDAAAVSPLRIDGLIAPVATPWAENHSVDLAVVQKQSKYLKRTGIKRVFVGGTTGSSLALTVSERQALLEAWARTNHTIIAHVGAESLNDAKALARHANATGVAAIACMPPVFFKPATVRILAQWLKAVAETAPQLPLYYYHIPSMTGTAFMMMDLIDEIENIGIPTFVGVKYTGLYEPDAFPDFQSCISRDGGKYEIFSGREELMVEALSVGVRGFIGGNFNFAGDLYEALLQRWFDASVNRSQTATASTMQQHAVNLMRLQRKLPVGVDTVKLSTNFAGLNLGPARLPFIEADQRSKQMFFDELAKWCAMGSRQLQLSLAMCEVPEQLRVL